MVTRPIWGFSKIIGRRPTLPHTRACSTIGAERLNYRVRDGNGWVPLAKITQKIVRRVGGGTHELNIDGPALQTLCVNSKFYGQAERAISNGQLNVLLR